MVVIEQTIGKFTIRAVNSAADDLENGISVFVRHNDEMIFCDNFDQNLHAAREYVKRNSKGKIKVINGEFHSK